MANVNKARRFTKQEMQAAFRHYQVTEQDGGFGLFPTNRRVQGDEVLLYPQEVPVDRYGVPIDLTTTWMVVPAELERIFQWKFGGKWALVRLGELSWIDPEMAALKLVDPLEATHMQVEILWDLEQAGNDKNLSRGEMPHWMCYRYRHTCENDPHQGGDFYMIDLTSPCLRRQSAVEDLWLRLALEHEERMKVGGKPWKK